MDVARIEAISPKQIDWRKLTAKEIIKYETNGLDVPSEYLQWARNFQLDLELNDNDEITYEKATAIVSNSSENSSVASNGEESSSELEKVAQSEEEPLTAKEKYKQMRDNGNGLYKIGKTFRGDCDTKAENSEESSTSLGMIDETSNNEIEALESYMSGLLSDATDIKAQIAALKNKKSDTNFGKINKLQNELKRLGITGQSIAAQYEGDMIGFKSFIDSQVDIGPDAEDYGAESVDIAEKLKQIGKIPNLDNYYALGLKLLKSGKNAIDKGGNASQVFQATSNSNVENLSKISDIQTTIANQTGIAASVGKSEDSESNKDNNKKQESEKAVQAAQNDGTDTTAKATTNLDEILKAKIRRGENIDNV